MQARASAMDELIESGTLEDFTTDKTQLDRELEAISSQAQVDADLARLKSEVGAGEAQKELNQ
jgi:phage shock protein A